MNQLDTVRAILKMKGTVTQGEANMEMGLTRLSQHVMTLRRKYGWDIAMERKKAPSGRWYGRYHLIKAGL